MGKSNVAAGIAAVFFALSGMAETTTAVLTVPLALEEERVILLDDFNRLAKPTLDDRLIAINRILDTYPSTSAKAEDFSALIQSPDMNESIRGQLCLTANRLNNSPEILTHDGLGSRGDEDIPAMSRQLGLANVLFQTANRVCGFENPLVPFVIERKDNSELNCVPSKDAPPPEKQRKDVPSPSEKPEPAPVRGFVMAA